MTTTRDCYHEWIHEPTGVLIACLRPPGHHGRHIARHPIDLGEHVFLPPQREEHTEA